MSATSSTPSLSFISLPSYSFFLVNFDGDLRFFSLSSAKLVAVYFLKGEGSGPSGFFVDIFGLSFSFKSVVGKLGPFCLSVLSIS
jgi:hypothetical protein